MAVYTVIAHQRLNDYAVVQTLTDTEIEPGQSITLAGLGHGLNGTHTVLFCPQYAFTGTDGVTGEWTYNPEVPRANQVLFSDPGDDLEFTTAVPTGTLTWTQTCTWVTNAMVEEWLGIRPPAVCQHRAAAKCGQGRLAPESRPWHQTMQTNQRCHARGKAAPHT